MNIYTTYVCIATRRCFNVSVLLTDHHLCLPPPCSITNTFEAFTLNLLSSLLISGPNSPFYKALIESGLGTDFSPDVG